MPSLPSLNEPTDHHQVAITPTPQQLTIDPSPPTHPPAPPPTLLPTHPPTHLPIHPAQLMSPPITTPTPTPTTTSNSIKRPHTTPCLAPPYSISVPHPYTRPEYTDDQAGRSSY
ncbi:hypothetical protein Pcinc_026399 [Petrolisthes cinctipes]|uniref:Uncharacterized protein n=1 Tax=Petrolisthes cinctipes TaxID=88211 RepID=A0AAE1KA47_PETCI|nr:hypothetical protein Pcinc_026399 [Petrolisthes cinctipes]